MGHSYNKNNKKGQKINIIWQDDGNIYLICINVGRPSVHIVIYSLYFVICKFLEERNVSLHIKKLKKTGVQTEYLTIP